MKNALFIFIDEYRSINELFRTEEMFLDEPLARFVLAVSSAFNRARRGSTRGDWTP